MSIQLKLLILLATFLVACQATPTPAPAPTATIPPSTPTAAPTATIEAPTGVLPNATTRRLQPGELILAANDGDIPAINATDDLFVSPAEGDNEWLDDELIIGFVNNGVARAYPVRLMSLHEIVNDTVGGDPVAITWCPLCFSAIVFDRTFEGRVLEFQVSGFLYRNNLVMVDRQTNTYWDQLVGQGIRDVHSRDHLTTLPSAMTSWAEWKERYPNTTVLSAERMGRVEEVIDPYVSYYESGIAGIFGDENVNEALPAKSLVGGLITGKVARAYPLATIVAERAINDTLDDIPVLVVLDPEFQTGFAFGREVDGLVLTFQLTEQNELIDNETGSMWSIATGEAVSGEMMGAELPAIPITIGFWFSWQGIHPDTEIYMTAE